MKDICFNVFFRFTLFFQCILFCGCNGVTETQELFSSEFPKLLFREEGTYFAFTDLIFFENTWYLTFRKSDDHVGGEDGVILVYSSHNFVDWSKETEFSLRGIDLRDPDFYIWDSKLQIKVHGSTYDSDKKLVGFNEYISSHDGRRWGDFIEIQTDSDFWLWKFFEVDQKLLSIGYSPDLSSSPPTSSKIALFQIANRKSIKLCDFDLEGYYNEGFIKKIDGKNIIVIRNEFGALFLGEVNLGNCKLKSYDFPLDIKGGMNMTVLNDFGVLRIVGRTNQSLNPSITSVDYDMINRTVIKVDSIPSGGDCGYIGMVQSDSISYLSYYSTHLGNAIFVNKLDID